jgi:WD40 repeat protein
LAETPEHVACHPDGDRVALAALPGKIRLANAEGREVLSLEAIDGDVTDLEFSPDGQNLIATYRDFGARIWRAPRDASEAEDGVVAGP